MIDLHHKNERGQAPYGWIKLAGMTCYFSYDTVIAAYINHKMYHVHNDWGSTTGKHMNKLFNRHLSIEVDAEELSRLIKEQLVTYGLDYVKERLDGKETGTR